MWRKFITVIVIPILFVVVGIAIALFSVDIVRYSQRVYSQNSNEPEWILSPYDEMFQTIESIYGIDWVLLSAIANVESKFTPTAVSKAGAVGLMQVMPAVAKSMGYAPESLVDSRVCAEVAARLLHENNAMLRFPSDFDGNERLKFILACYNAGYSRVADARRLARYNAGYSRVADARRLARYYDADADKWEVVSDYLKLLAEPEYVEHEMVQSGEFKGSAETIAYVRRVMNLYGRYKRRVANWYDNI